MLTEKIIGYSNMQVMATNIISFSWMKLASLLWIVKK